ncbi:bifunctional diguanylate cyclase/phosphodiesterase [Aneurinibacillus terranovensis]|uniref:bifunctional diguanylate cyclase/phosphodiesterase n=1 Tax=Aneurinibacillus terranovensis TaxID=278991 RepID=UPI0003FFC5BB|nr:EAL domain-containing protein [Aneurinibacillus terranovensis]
MVHATFEISDFDAVHLQSPVHPSTLRQTAWITFILMAGILLVYIMQPPLTLLEGSPIAVFLHNSMEGIGIVVAFMVYGIGWHAYSGKRTGNTVLLACAFLGVGLIDFAHILSYPGTPDFVTPSSPEKAIDFWLAARFLASAALLSIVLLHGKPFNSAYTRYVHLLGSFTFTALVYWVVLFHDDIVPETFVAGKGLTPFKMSAEYFIIAIHGVTALLLMTKSRKSQSFHASHLLTAVTIMMLSELCFTLFASVTDVFFFLGHAYKILAYMFIYRAVFVEHVHKPFVLLYKSEQTLLKNREWLTTTLTSVSDAVISTDVNGIVTFMNPAAEKLTQCKLADAAGKEVREVFQITSEPHSVFEVLCEGAESLQMVDTVLITRSGVEIPIETSAAPIQHGKGNRLGVVLVFRDVTARKQAEDVQNRLIAILEKIPDFVATADIEGRALYYNDAAREMLGIDKCEDISSITIPDTHPEWAGRLVLSEGLPTAARDGVWSGETAFLSRDGREIPVSQIVLSHKKADGTIEYFSTIARDLTEMKQFENKQRLASQVFDNITEGIMVTDREGTILFVNPAFSVVTGYSEEEVIGNNPRILSSGLHQTEFYKEMWAALHETGRWKGEIWNRNKKQEIYLVEISITTVKDDLGEAMHYVGVFEDITLRKQMESKIQYQAYHDMLTGLPNRVLFNDRLDQAIDHSSCNNKKLAVMFIDLDQFKRINAMFGHCIGDDLLQAVAECLKRCIRESDTIARFGGDEFMILLPEVFHEQDAVTVAEKIIEALRQPLMLGDRELFISSSIGISVYPADGNDSKTLIKNADTAMYHAKKQGRNNYQLYRSLMNDDEAFERLTLENSLRKALQKDEFLVYYQPQINLHTGEIIGMEALVRWQNPELGMVPPVKFIPLAEDTGLIIPLGEWVLRAACTQNKAWQLAGYPPIRVAVNLSMLQFKQSDMVGTIVRVLQETGLDPRYLEVEITESMLMENPDATLGTLKQLKAIGIRISLDDFGTGYSSLNYLKRLSIDTLKIDQSFVRDIATDADDRAIVNSIIHLAHSMNLRVIAEGVETTEQLNFLRSHQCDEIQGYLIGYPLPAGEFVHLMRTGFQYSG